MNIRPAMPRPINGGARATSAAVAPTKPEASRKPDTKPVTKLINPAEVSKSLDPRVIGSAVSSGVVGGIAGAMLFAGAGAAIVVPAVIIGSLFLGALGMWSAGFAVAKLDQQGSK